MIETNAAVLFLGRSGGADVDDARGHGVSCVLLELAPACDTFPQQPLVTPEAL